MSDYDKNIHFSPDAKVWADFFMRTKKEQNWKIEDIDEGLMLGWFANAMMAMHDYLTTRQAIKEAELILKKEQK
jgi:hypothetical protein